MGHHTSSYVKVKTTLVTGSAFDECCSAVDAPMYCRMESAQVIVQLHRRPSPDTGDAFLQKAVSPEFDGIDAARLTATDCCQSLPARQTQDDLNSSHIIGSAALAAAYSRKPYTKTVRCHCYRALGLENDVHPVV